VTRGTKSYLSTREVAEICEVTHVTVGNWIRSGKLKAWRVPGGWYRIRPEDLFTFLAAGEMPVPEGLGVQRGSPRQHVLVVDDDPVFVDVVTRALSAFSDRYHVISASDGFDAGRKIAECRPDAVILDLRMPGLDGFSVCERLKQSEEYADIKVIVASGYLDEEARAQAEAAGADLCLAKPLGPDELLQALCHLLPSPREGSLVPS
jgi:excisionase family DNA binding protein